MVLRYTEFEIPSETGVADGQLDFGGTAIDTSLIAARNALGVDRLIEPLRAALDAQGLSDLNDTIEVPLVAVLARMEALGVGVDVAELQRLRDHLTSEVARLRGLIHTDAGEEFNVNSTKQLREILFQRLELTPQKKTKTGYSTDAASLEKLRGEHPIIEHLLDYREVEKLRSTYGEGLLAEVGEGDRIRATSTRPLLEPVASVPTPRTCTTFQCGQRWDGHFARHSFQPRGSSYSLPTTTKSSSDALRIWPKIPA